jgi:DNA-binding CsgD family transcriptional regulator
MTRLPGWLTARRPAGIAVLLMLQALAAVFFLGDVIGDALEEPVGLHTVIEAITAISLIVGMGFGALTLRGLLERMRAQESALAVAKGALAEVIDAQFTAWRLTPAERDVGLLALKGLDVAEIAAMRNAAAGTVRAQLTHIYAKAGVSGRAQFAAFFVEDLLGGALPG